MAEATKKEILSSNTYDANVRDKLNEEPTLIYYGSLDNSGEAQVEDTFKIPAGYAVEKVTAYNNSGATTNTVDKLGVGTTATSGVDIVAAVVLPEDSMKECTIASSVISASDQIGYIHTLDGTSATYDIVCNYTIVLRKLYFTE
jgi:hypothetical protein